MRIKSLKKRWEKIEAYKFIVSCYMVPNLQLFYKCLINYLFKLIQNLLI